MKLKYVIDGDNHDQVMFFVHGWPDDATLWEKQIEHFSKKYACVRVTLPNCAKELDRKEGFDFLELVTLLKDCIEEVTQNKNEKKVILVGHDWGAYLSYMLENKHPNLVKKMIMLDVGAHFSPSSIGHKFFILSYQWWLICAWLSGKVLPMVGNFMTNLFAQRAHAPRAGKVNSEMNYFYFYIWRSLLLPQYRQRILGKYTPQCPLLYIYGGNKKYHFHSEKWAQFLKKSSQHEIKCIPDADHWLMIRNPERTNQLMVDWLSTDWPQHVPEVQA